MTRLIAVAAILGFSVASAAAECSSKHTAQADIDQTKTASIATDMNTGIPASTSTKPADIAIPAEE